MNQRITEWLNLSSGLIISSLALIIPIFFWNLTSEFYEIPKILIVVTATVLMLVLWGLKFLLTGKLTVIRTPLDLAFLLLIVVFLISTYFSQSYYASIFGQMPRLHGSAVSYIIYIIFYFVFVSNIRDLGVAKKIIYLLIASGVVLSVLSLLSYLGVNVFLLPFTSALNFTPSGSTFSTNALLILSLPFLLIPIIRDEQNESITEATRGTKMPADLATKIIFTVILVLFTTTIVLTGSLTVYIAASLAFILTLLVTPPVQVNKNLPYITLPLVVALFLAFLSFVPIATSKNVFYQQAQNFPREIQLPFTTSWKVSVSAFRDSPFFGTGPATYLGDFTLYKPAEFNSHTFWNIRFDQGFNEYFHFLATLGAAGLIVLMLLTVLFLSSAFKALGSPESSLSESTAIAGILFFILLALHASTGFLWIIGIIILGLFMLAHREVTREVNFKSSAHLDLDRSEFRFDPFPVLVLLIVLGLTGISLFYTGKYTLADYYHRQALNSVAANNGILTYNQLVKAEQLNPNVDLYRTDLAQTNFALANAIATAKGPTEASPGGSLTAEDQQNIQQLLSQAIAEGRAAVTLNPVNSANWEILGSIYRQISGVAQNALSFSLDAYGRAIQRDPTNPLTRLTVGGIYYSAQNYDLAIRFFSDAINLKPDYANAYFNLAIALREKNDLNGAAQAAEKTVTLLDPSSPDYPVAANLLSELRDTIASVAAKQKAAQSTEAVPPAAQTSGVLQNQNLPKVLSLPESDKIATPEAVKKTSSTPTPNP